MVATQDKEPRPKPSRIGYLLAAALIGLALVWSLPAPALARGGWFIDPDRFNRSVHRDMSCLECHDQVADQERHPDPAKVSLDPNHAFETDRCLMCHDQVAEDLENRTHGAKQGIDSELYGNCILCHDPHYATRPGEKAEPGQAKEPLPEPSEDDLECLKCHQPGRVKDQAEDKGPVRAAPLICRECHLAAESKDLEGVPLLDPQAYARTTHAGEGCLTCHPGAAAYNHDRQKQGDCLQCHGPDHGGELHDTHRLVSCQACHLPGAVPERDFAARRIGWTLGRSKEGPSRVHEFLGEDQARETCARCHTSGNRLGAAAMVLPSKSMICLPCHRATLTLTDTTSIVAMLIFLVGLVAALGFWFRGQGTGPIRTVLGTLFSARIGIILKSLVVDGLLQRRLFHHSPGRWAVHALIFWPFVLRFGYGLAAMILGSLWPDWPMTQLLVDKNHPLTALVFDLTGLSILAGAGLAVGRRFLSEARDKIVNLPGQDRLALALLGGIVVIGFLLEGMRIAMTSAPGGAHWAFFGYALSMFMRGMDLTGVYGYVWYAHAILTGAFLAYLPFSRMFHILTGPLALALKAASQEDHHHPGPGLEGNEE